MQLIAAYANFDQWGSSSDDWTITYYSQAFFGMTAAWAWGTSYLFGYNILFTYAAIDLMAQGVNVALVYNAESK